MSELAVVNAWASIVQAQELEIEALQFALALERGEQWITLNPLAYGKLLRKLGDRRPDYLVRAWNAWQLKNMKIPVDE